MSKLALKAGRPSERGGVAKATMLADLVGKPTKPIRINFDLDREQHMRLKLLAIKKGRSVTDILRELVASELDVNQGL